MSLLARIGSFAAALLAVFGAAFAVGHKVDPIRETPSSQHGAHAEQPMAAAGQPGLAVTDGDYTLVPAFTTIAAAGRTSYSFTVQGPDGKPLTSYTASHTKELHLIVVRRDLSTFAHLHPSRDAHGTWSAQLTLPAAGDYRVLADFIPAGADNPVVLGTDLSVGGTYRPAALPPASTTSSVDGYDVTLSGDAVAEAESDLTFTVTRAGQPVTDLQPYLGAFGHLVALRAGDLGYLHTHPAVDARGNERGGPQIRFGTEFPSPGSYRLFLQFQAGGEVHTAAFTVLVPPPGEHGHGGQG
jgi:hypothetical protein